MPLKGSLGDFSLPDLFQLIQFGRKNGTLNIRNGEARGYVCFRKGKVFFATHNWKKPQLGQRLVRDGAITEEELEEALDLQKTTRKDQRLGNVLVELGYLSRESLENLLREQIKDAVFHLLSWTEGEFDFDPKHTFPEEDVGLSMSAENIIMEGSRRLEEWKQIETKIPSLDAVFKMKKVPDHITTDVDLTSEEWSVLYHIDGHTTVRGIIGKSGQSPLVTCKALYGLLAAGLVTMVTGGEADTRFAGGLEAEIGEFEQEQYGGKEKAPEIKTVTVETSAAVEEPEAEVVEEAGEEEAGEVETIESAETPVTGESAEEVEAVEATESEDMAEAAEVEEPLTVEPEETDALLAESDEDRSIVVEGTGAPEDEEEVEREAEEPAGRKPLLRKKSVKRGRRRKGKKATREPAEVEEDTSAIAMEASLDEQETAAAIPETDASEEAPPATAKEPEPASGQSLVDYYKSLAIEEASDAEKITAYRDTEDREQFPDESFSPQGTSEAEEESEVDVKMQDDDMREPEEIPLEWMQHLNRLRGVVNLPKKKRTPSFRGGEEMPADETASNEYEELERLVASEAERQEAAIADFTDEAAIEESLEEEIAVEEAPVEVEPYLIELAEVTEYKPTLEPIAPVEEERAVEVSEGVAAEETAPTEYELAEEQLVSDEEPAIQEPVAEETPVTVEPVSEETLEEEAVIEEVSAEDEALVVELTEVTVYEPTVEPAISVDEKTAEKAEVESEGATVEESAVADTGPLPLEDEIERLLQEIPEGVQALENDELIAFDQPASSEVESVEAGEIEKASQDVEVEEIEAVAAAPDETGEAEIELVIPEPLITGPDPDRGEETVELGTVIEFPVSAVEQAVEIVEVVLEEPEPLVGTVLVEDVGFADELQIVVLEDTATKGEMTAEIAGGSAQTAVAPNELLMEEIPLVLELPREQEAVFEAAVESSGTIEDAAGLGVAVEETLEIEGLESPVKGTASFSPGTVAPAFAEDLDVFVAPVEQAIGEEEESREPAIETAERESVEDVLDIVSSAGEPGVEAVEAELVLTETEQESSEAFDIEEEMEAIKELTGATQTDESSAVEEEAVEEVVVIPEVSEDEVAKLEEELEEDDETGLADGMRVGGRRGAGTSLIDLETFELERELLELAGTVEKKRRIPMKNRDAGGGTGGKKTKKGAKEAKGKKNSGGGGGKTTASGGSKSPGAKEVDKGSIKKIIDELKKM